MDDAQLLKNIFTAQVLVLANQIKAEKQSKNITSTSDFTAEAIALIERKEPQILRTLQQAP
jgi:hypothetical protein